MSQVPYRLRYAARPSVENNKNKKSVKFQGDMLNCCDFIQVYVFTTNHHPKVNGYAFRGSNPNIFYVVSLLNRVSTLKGKNLLLYEQNLSFTSRPHFGRF